jgi:hypothetical protein
VKGIDHLVLCGRDLDPMREGYRRLGFTLTPPARHPFGTGNSLVQLESCFLELLMVADPSSIPEHGPSTFSFAAFNRDFLETGEGFSMLVLDSLDARSDAERMRAAGLRTYEPFDFSRKAKLPSGEEVTVGFSLAFASDPELPSAGFFTCQQHAPQHFWKPEYQRHANTARSILEVCLVADEPRRLDRFMSGFTGAAPERSAAGSRFKTARGDVFIVTPAGFRECYGTAVSAAHRGPRFAGFTIAVEDDGFIRALGPTKVDERWVFSADQAFGTCIAFMRTSAHEGSK